MLSAVAYDTQTVSACDLATFSQRAVLVSINAVKREKLNIFLDQFVLHNVS